MAPASMTTNDDDRPPISLAAERKQASLGHGRHSNGTP